MRTIIVVTAAFAFSLLGAHSAHAATPLSVRAYVDAGYGKDAQKKAQAVVADAAKIFEAATGTPLQLVETKAWTPSPAASKNLRAAVGELASTDKGTDALVVGFIGAQAQAGTDYHKLMLAKPLARQAAVRDAGDAHEDALIVVNALAHLLGGVDSPDATTILSANFAKDQAKLADDSLALVKLGVVFAQAKTDVERGNAAAQLKRELNARKAKLDAKSAGELASSLDDLAATASQEMVLPPEQAKMFNDAVAALNAKDYAGAFAKIKALADDPKAPGRVLTLACRLDGYDGVNDKDAASRCDRALKTTSDVDAVDSALRYAVHAKDAAMLKRAFAEGESRLAKVKIAGSEVDELASIALNTGHLTLADEAISKSSANNVAEVKGMIELQRRREGLPKGAVSFEDEPTIIDIMQAANDSKHVNDALEDIDAALKKYGEVPGLIAERCDLLRKKGKLRDAEADCEKALAKYPDGSSAEMIAGMTYADDDIVAKAIPHLEKAIALDPAIAQSYEILDKLYHQVGKRDERKKLQAAYQAKFGKPLGEN